MTTRPQGTAQPTTDRSTAGDEAGATLPPTPAPWGPHWTPAPENGDYAEMYGSLSEAVRIFLNEGDAGFLARTLAYTDECRRLRRATREG